MLKIPKSSQVKIFYKKGPSLESRGSCLSHLALDNPGPMSQPRTN